MIKKKKQVSRTKFLFGQFLYSLRHGKNNKNGRNKAYLALLAMSMTAITLFVNYDTVVVSYGDEIVMFQTFENDPYEIAKKSKFEISEEDEIISHIDNGIVYVEIAPLMAINVQSDGETKTISMTRGTVGDALEIGGIEYSSGDILSHSLSAELEDDMEIVVQRVSYETVEYSESIPRETVTVKTDSLPLGTELESEVGEDGLMITVLQKKYLDGEFVEEKLIEATVVKEPVDSVVEVGTAPIEIRPTEEYVPVEVDIETLSYSEAILMEATAYTFGSSGSWGDVTATGKEVKVGYVAVDPKVIPLGTELYITFPDGSACYGFATAQDTGGAIKGNKIDLFFNTSEECFAFGRRDVMVYVLD